MNVERLKKYLQGFGFLLMGIGMVFMLYNVTQSNWYSPNNLCQGNSDNCLETNISVMDSLDPERAQAFREWRDNEKRVQDNGWKAFYVLIAGTLVVINTAPSRPKSRLRKQIDWHVERLLVRIRGKISDQSTPASPDNPDRNTHSTAPSGTSS